MKPTIIKLAKIIGWIILGLFTLGLALQVYGSWYDEWSGFNASMYVSDGMCTIAVIPMQGEVLAYEGAYGTGDMDDAVSPEDVRAALARAESDPFIYGVLVRLDSPGGSPAGGEAITDALKDSSMPVVALVGDRAASSGYMIATGADTIIASSFSDVGSIGVTMSYLDMTRYNREHGYEYVELTSAPYKDYLSSERPLTPAERALVQRDLKIYHDAFVALVAENRDLPVEDVAALADGSSMPASLALEHKLIDSIGNADTAREWFAETLGLALDDIVLCE